MNITKEIKKMKREPGFSENVGMILVHNGVVREWSRKKKGRVKSIDVTPDIDKIEALRSEYEKKPGIFRILVEAKSGMLKPGDDLLYIIVAGDIRENVKPVLSELLDRVKAEAVGKSEAIE